MMAAASDRFVGKLLAGTYHVGRLIGRGGMGAIYEATHTRLQGKRYAIKVLGSHFTEEPELLVRFRREAEIASQLGHDNIVAVHDFNVADGQAYMVMELLEGEDLAARLRAGPLPLDEMKRIVDQVTSALDSAHRAQIVHRDLKPQNIFLCRRAGQHDHVKVLDFGVSKVLDSSSVVTRDHALVGTPFYMSPEQADGRVNEIDARTDVFALGAIVWEMLAGRMAFEASTLAAALFKVCCADPPDIHLIRSDVPPALSLVLRRALAKDRQQRTPSVLQMAAELAASLHGIVPAGLPRPASGALESMSSGELSMAVAGTAMGAVSPPPGWAVNPVSSSPMAPSGSALAPTPRVPGLLPTMPSFSGAPLAAIGASGAASAAGWPVAGHPGAASGYSAPGGALAPGPMVAPTGSIASSPVAHLASAPGPSSLAVGSVMVQPQSSRLRVAVIAGVVALLLGLGVWAVMSRGTGEPATPPSPAAPGLAVANPAAPPARAAEATGPSGAGSGSTATPSTSESESRGVRSPPVESTSESESRGTESPTAPPAGRGASPPPKALEVALFLVVEPRGAKARITLDNKKMTERLVHVPRSDTPLTVTAEATGFVTYHGDVLPDRDQTVAIVLKRKAPRASAPTPATRPPAAATRTAPAVPSATDAAMRGAQEPSPVDAAMRAAPAPPTPRNQPGPPSNPAAPVAGSPQAGTPASGAQQLPPPAPLPPPAQLPPPPAPPKKKTGTIFDQ